MAGDVTQSEWTLKRLLEWTSDYLGRAAVEQSRLCSEILLAEALQCQRIELYTNFDRCPDEDQLAHFRAWVQRCVCHEPVAYLIGKAHFYGLEFKVTPAVLVPRPETELLVTEALNFLRQTIRPTVDVLDLCTGSGCVAVALAANVVEAEVIAADCSGDALQIARSNIKQHDLLERVSTCRSDLFANIEQSGKAVFDLIVSNPPYVSTAQFEKLSPTIRNHEPRQALQAGDDGLDYHRRILADCQAYLADGAALMLEVAYDQAGQVVGLCEQAGFLTDIATVRDALGHERVVRARKL